MQIGIDLGATKIESVVLLDDGTEKYRERVSSPNNYEDTINSIEKIVFKIEEKFKKKINVGVCHPGSINTDGFVFNSNNSPWLNNQKLNTDLNKRLDRNIFCENDANCFALSESIDGAAKHYKVVFGIILGSGCGGGLVIDKKIFSGTNKLTGEWGHNFLPGYGILNEENKKIENSYDFTIEQFISGKGIEKIFKKDISAKEIFKLNRKGDKDAKNYINLFNDKLARSLASLINILDPDAFVFGGGVSNEIDNLEEIKKLTAKYLNKIDLNTVFLKPIYGDASGVRGAAYLSRKNSI
jgi:fructokinase